MASASAIKAGEAYVTLSSRDGELAKGLQRAAARLKAFGAGVMSLGEQVVRLGVGAGIPLYLSADAFATFEQAMARVKALSQATEPEFAALGAEAKRLGLDTVFSARQAAQTMGVFALAGLRAKDIIHAMAPTLDVAAAGQMDLAQAADIGLKAIHGLGYEAKDMRTVMDVLGKAMITANTDLVMLGEAFKYVGPVAKAAGVGIHEITAAIQILSNAGIQADMAGTTLRGMILSLTSPSAEALAELRKLGVQVNDQRGNFRGLAAVIGDLEKALDGVGTGKRLESLGRIFPARAAAGAAELLAQGGDKIRRFTAALKDSGGTIGNVAAVQLNTLKGATTLLLSSIEGLAIEIGAGLAPVLRSLGEVLTVTTNAMAGWARLNPEVWAGLTKGVLAVTMLGASLFALGLSIKVAAFAFGGIVTAVAALKAAFIFYNFNKAFVAFKWIASIGGWFVTSTNAGRQALAGLSAYALSVADAVGRGFRQMMETAREAWAGIGDAVATGDFAAAARITMLAVKLEWARGLLGVGEMWDGLLNNMSKMGGGFVMFLSDAWALLQYAWLETVGVIADTWLHLTTWMAKTWQKTKFWKSDDEVNAKVAEIQEKADAELKASRKDRMKKIRATNEDRVGRAEQIRQSVEMEIAERNRARQKKVDDARREFDEAVGGARDKRWMKDTTEGWKKVGQSFYDRYLKGLGQQGKLPSAGKAAAELGKVEAAGSFNTFALAGMGAGSSLPERTAKAAEETAANTRRMNERLENMGRAT